MSGAKDETSTARDADPSPLSRTRAEWALFGVSSAVILAVVTLLVAQWAVAASGPPAFRAIAEPMRQVNGQYQVPVTVENIGNEAAAGVIVTGKLRLRGQETAAEQTLDFLSPDQKATVTFAFDRDPRSGELSVSVTGFRES